jgi:hypothetical protein
VSDADRLVLDERAKLYAHAESHRIGVELAKGPNRTDAEYKLLFEQMLASAFVIGYAAGEDDARFRHQPHTRTAKAPVPFARRK